MKFVCDLDGKEFKYKPTPLSKAIARRSVRMHIATLLVELGLPFDATFQQAKETYMSREEIRELRRSGTSVRDLARMYDLPERKVDRWTEDIVISPKKPTRGPVPRPVREPQSPAWKRSDAD